MSKGGMVMKAKVDQDVCIGSGNCEATCPTIFKVVDGKSQVQVDTVPEKEESCVEEAVDGCPVGAISIA
jgi:ferredoxin